MCFRGILDLVVQTGFVSNRQKITGPHPGPCFIKIRIIFRLKLFLLCVQEVVTQFVLYSSICPRSSSRFYKVTYYVKWVTTSWTDCINIWHFKKIWINMINFGQLTLQEKMYWILDLVVQTGCGSDPPVVLWLKKPGYIFHYFG